MDARFRRRPDGICEIVRQRAGGTPAPRGATAEVATLLTVFVGVVLLAAGFVYAVVAVPVGLALGAYLAIRLARRRAPAPVALHPAVRRGSSPRPTRTGA